MRIVRNEVGWFTPKVCKIAASPTGHENFLADLVGSLEHEHIATVLRGRYRAHQTSGTAADNEDIGIRHAGRITGGLDTNEADDRLGAQFLPLLFFISRFCGG